MKPPQQQIEPKDRTQLWKETVMGGILFVFGLVLIWQYTAHQEHGHTMEQVVLWAGVGCVGTGLFWSNKKLAQEWLGEVRKFVPFLRDKSGS